MDDQQERLMDLFNEARAKGSAEERAAYLDAACQGDADLRRQVEVLLRAHEQVGDFLQPTMVVGDDKLIGEGPGRVIGRYKLLQEIGEGGFGVVFMAEQLEPVQRKVALKIIKPGMDTKEVIARFEAERQALALMDHPNIAQVLDGGATESGRPYFVMELVKGIKITDYCDQNDLSTEERLNLFIKVCHAVQHAHQKGVIHRDLKPSNVMITLHDGEAVPKVIDFGIAKATGQKLTEKTLFTRYEQMIGTPAYMSPEQAAMSGLDIDTRTDIYALGVLLYELLTGVTPFDKDTLAKAALDEIRRLIRETEPPKPSTRLHTMGDKLTEVAKHRHTEPGGLRRAVHGDLDWIVMKAMEKDRTRRYDTAGALLEDVQHHLNHEPVKASPPGAGYRARKFVRRHRMGVALAASVTAALIAGLVVALVAFAQARRERDRSVRAEQRAQHERDRAERLAREEATQRQRAQAEEKKARAAATKSQQVAKFLEDMLEGVGPSVARGRDTTMLREILDKTAERVRKDLNDQLDVKAELQYTMARVYRALAEYDRAEALHREALAIRRKLRGDEHLDVAASLYWLANTLEEQHRPPEEAEFLYREALAIQRKVLGNEHVDVALSLRGVASALESQGKYAWAEPPFREALAIRKKLLGSEHPDVAFSLHELAYVLGRQGKLDEAEQLGREALAQLRKLLVTDHPDLAQCLSALGQIQSWKQNYAEAETLFRESVEMQRRLMGKDHDYVSSMLKYLGNMLHEQGKLAEAEAAYREALEGMGDSITRWPRWPALDSVPKSFNGLAGVLRQQGRLAEVPMRYNDARILDGLAWSLAVAGNPESRDGRAAVHIAETAVAATARTNAMYLDTLAAAYAEAGQFTNAVNVQLEAIALVINQQQKEDYAARLRLYQSGVSYHDHAGFGWRAGQLFAAGRFAEAEALHRQELARRRKTVGNTHRDVALSLHQLGAVLSAQGKLAEAETAIREGLAIERRFLDSNDPVLATRLAGLTSVLLARNDFTPAEPPARECLTIREKKLPDDWLTFSARSMLGGSLLGQKKYAEAEPLLLSGYEGMKQREDKIPAAGRPRVKETLQRLVQVYEATGRADQGAEWKQKLDEFEKAETEQKPAAGTPPK